MGSRVFSGDFWSRFVEQYWEKEPCLIRQPFSGLFATPPEIFQGVVCASDRYRGEGRSESLQLYIGHAALMAAVGKHLPTRDDGSVAGYAARMTRELNGERFGLIVDDFQANDAMLWFRIRRFLRGLYELVGIARENAKAILWLGNYEKTPFGLHPGHSNSFMFLIEGPKRMRIWPKEFFRRRENLAHSLDYEQFLDNATTLEGEAGDVLYWPADRWHVGESVSCGLSVALSVALFMRSGLLDDLPDSFSRLIQSPLSANHAASDRVDPDRPDAGVAAIRRRLERSIKTLRRISQADELKLALAVSTLNRTTGFGFTTVPPPLPRTTLKNADVICIRPDCRILWMRSGGGDAICSANGHAFSITAHPNVIKLFERLNTGLAFRVKDLIEEHAGSARVNRVECQASPGDIRALLKKLHGLRAVVRRDDGLDERS